MDACADIDVAKLEQTGNEIMEHMVNFDLVSYQFDMQKLVDHATELGLHPSEFDFSDESKEKVIKIAKCIDSKTPLS